MGNPYAPPSGNAPPMGSAPPPGATPPGGTAPGGTPPGATPPGELPPGGGPRPPAPSPHPPGPPPHPAPPPPDPLVVKAAGKRIATFSLLVLAAVITSTLPLPWQAASVGFVLAALVLGVRALILSWRAGLRGALITLLAVGLSFTGVLAVSLTSLLLIWPVQLERQQCLQGALTIAATQQCEADFQNALEDRLRQLSETAPGS